jgi:hypothetical protein
MAALVSDAEDAELSEGQKPKLLDAGAGAHGAAYSLGLPRRILVPILVGPMIVQHACVSPNTGSCINDASTCDVHSSSEVVECHLRNRAQNCTEHQSMEHEVVLTGVCCV